MANPFTVQPLGGLQNIQMIGQGLQGIAQNVQADRAEQERAQIMQQFSEAMDRGNPQEIAQLSMQYPEIGQAAMGGIKFANEATKANLRDSMQRVVAGEDPVQVLQDRIQVVEAQGGDASDSRRELEAAMQDPEAYRKQVEGIYAMSFPAEYTAFRKATGAGSGPNIGQYNPRDYTTDSFAQFVRSGDPSVLERYAAQRSVDIGGVPHVFDPAIGGYRPAGVAGAGGAQPVTAETVGESEAQIAARRTRAQEQARQDVESQSPQEVRQAAEAQRASEQNISNFQGIVTQAQSLLDNEDYLDAMSGISGKVLAIPGTERYDAEIAFNQFKDTLTLGNLDKMSGVLTDRDIQVLSSAAGGIEAGMSRAALESRLKTVRDIFSSKTEAEQRKLRELMRQPAQETSQNQQPQRSTPRIRLDARGNIIQ